MWGLEAERGGWHVGSDVTQAGSAAGGALEGETAHGEGISVVDKHTRLTEGAAECVGACYPVYMDVQCSKIAALQSSCCRDIHDCYRLHQSSAIHSAASPIATALPFSSGQLSPAQADTPRFATLGMLGSSSQRRSMLGGSTSHAYGQPSRLQGDESVPPAQARMSSSYSQNLPESPGQLPPNSMTSSFRSPVGPGVAQHACRDAQSASYAQFRSRDSVYPQHGLTGSPAQRARPSSPYHGAVSGSSPLRSPAHAAAVSAVEQQLHASLHEQQGHPQHRPAPTSPSALPGSHQHKEHSQDRLDSAIAYQPWRGHARSLNAPQHSGQDLHDMPHSLSQASQLSQVPQDSHSLLRPSSQYLGHASPELDSLSQRLRDQKVAMDRHGRFGISPLQSRAAGHSPGQERLTAGAVPRSTGAGSTYTHSALPERSPSR